MRYLWWYFGSGMIVGFSTAYSYAKAHWRDGRWTGKYPTSHAFALGLFLWPIVVPMVFICAVGSFIDGMVGVRREEK